MGTLRVQNDYLPDRISNLKFKCGVQCYDKQTSDAVLSYAKSAGVTRITAYRYNRYKGTLYPKSSTFFAWNSECLGSLLDGIIQTNKIKGVWTSGLEPIYWEEFYNVRIDDETDCMNGMVFKEVVGEETIEK